jgi:tetratricopeptide (TPR) repeat protein
VRKGTVAALGGLLVLGLLCCGPAAVRLARLNVGMIALSRAWIDEDASVWHTAALQAENQLRQVTRQAPENRSAWRGLGLALARQGRADEAIAAWRQVPGMVSDLMLWCQHALLTERYAQALEWCQWATGVEPALAAPWYFAGRAHEELQQWESALQAYQHALGLGDWSGLHPSSLHYRVGTLYLRRGMPGDAERAWQAFEAALQADDFDSLLERSDCHFQRGTILRLRERPVAEYIVEYERAIAIQPGHAAAQAQLGLAYYERDQDVRLAEVHLREAMTLDSQDGWPYVLLGEVYTGAGMRDRAKEMYERALQFEDVRGLAQQRLQALREPAGTPGLGPGGGP